MWVLDTWPQLQAKHIALPARGPESRGRLMGAPGVQSVTLSSSWVWRLWLETRINKIISISFGCMDHHNCQRASAPSRFLRIWAAAKGQWIPRRNSQGPPRPRLCILNTKVGRSRETYQAPKCHCKASFYTKQTLKDETVLRAHCKCLGDAKPNPVLLIPVSLLIQLCIWHLHLNIQKPSLNWKLQSALVTSTPWPQSCCLRGLFQVDPRRSPLSQGAQAKDTVALLDPSLSLMPHSLQKILLVLASTYTQNLTPLPSSITASLRGATCPGLRTPFLVCLDPLSIQQPGWVFWNLIREGSLLSLLQRMHCSFNLQIFRWLYSFHSSGSLLLAPLPRGLP